MRRYIWGILGPCAATRLGPYSASIPLLLRLTLGAVFLLFGVDKFSHPDRWVHWVPGWLEDAIEPPASIFLAAIFETSVGLLLLAGLLTRLAALAGALFLAAILVFIGADDTTTRDIGLFGEALALVISGGGRWSLDALLWRRAGGRS